jgi:hypothetical protein
MMEAVPRVLLAFVVHGDEYWNFCRRGNSEGMHSPATITSQSLKAAGHEPTVFHGRKQAVRAVSEDSQRFAA